MKGEINVDHADLQDVLRAAEALKIRGLVDFASGGGGDAMEAAELSGGEPQQGVRDTPCFDILANRSSLYFFLTFRRILFHH